MKQDRQTDRGRGAAARACKPWAVRCAASCLAGGSLARSWSCRQPWGQGTVMRCPSTQGIGNWTGKAASRWSRGLSRPLCSAPQACNPGEWASAAALASEPPGPGSAALPWFPGLSLVFLPMPSPTARPRENSLGASWGLVLCEPAWRGVSPRPPCRGRGGPGTLGIQTAFHQSLISMLIAV